MFQKDSQIWRKLISTSL